MVSPNHTGAGAQAEPLGLNKNAGGGPLLPNPLNRSASKALPKQWTKSCPEAIPWAHFLGCISLGTSAGGPGLICLEQAGGERLRTLREHTGCERTGHLLHRSNLRAARCYSLLTGARCGHLLAGIDVKGQAVCCILVATRHFLLPASQIPTPPTAPNLESDYEPLYEPTAVVLSLQEVALRQKVWANRQRYICFLAHILLRRT